MSYPNASDVIEQAKRNIDMLSITFLLILLVSLLAVILFSVRAILFIRERVGSGASAAGYLPLH
jgi:hypothetical protein